MLTNTQIAHGSQANSVQTNSYSVLLNADVCRRFGRLGYIALLAARGNMQKKAVIFFLEWHTPPSLLYSNISYFLNYAMLDRKNGLSKKASCTYTYFSFISNVEKKTGTLEQQSGFCLGMRHSSFPSFPTSQVPLSQSLLDRKYGHMDFLNVSSTFPSLLTSCYLHLQCRIEYIGLRSKKSGFALILFAAQYYRSSTN